MKRRLFNRAIMVATSLALVVSMLASCSGGGTSAGSNASSGGDKSAGDAAVTLRLGHTQPDDHLVNTTAKRFAELAKEYSGGSINIEIYPNSTFGTAAEMNAAIQSGDLDLYFNATAQFAAQYAPFSVVDAWYIFEDTDHLMKFYSPDCDTYQQLCKGLEDACGIESMGAIYYGARQMTSNVPFNSMNDLKGQKMRVASDPMPTAFFEAMGAVPTPVAYNETYLALQQKVADGQENPCASIDSMKFYEVQDYLNLTYHQYQMLTMFLSVETRGDLSDAQVDALRKAALKAADEHNAAAFDNEQAAIDKLSAHLEVIKPDLTAMMDACRKVYPDYESTWGAGVAAAIQALAG